jgi:hypothetical protein
MKTYIVCQLGYDSDSDQEFVFDQGLFLIHEHKPEVVPAKIVGYANHYWGDNWWGLSYHEWDNLNTETKRIFKETTE